MKASGSWVWLVIALSACGATPPANAPRASTQAKDPNPSSSADVAAIRQMLDGGRALLREGKPERAEISLQQAVQAAAALSPANPGLLAEALAELANCLVVGK